MDPAPSATTEPPSRVSIVEILAYGGITAGLYGTFLVLALEQPSQGLIGAVSLALCAVFLSSGALVGSGAPDRVGRLRSVCWYLAVQAFSSMLQAWMLSPTSLMSGVSDLFPIFLLTGLFAFALWLFSSRLLQQLAFYNAAIAALLVPVAPQPTSFVFGSPDLTGITLVLWVGGAAWFALGYAGRVRPPRTAMVLGMLTSIPGPLLFAVDSQEAAFLLVLATSVVYLFLGGRIADRAVSGIAVVGAVVGLVGFLVAVGVDDTGSGTAVLVVGVGLLVAGLLFARQAGGGRRPLLGSPVLPIGPGAVGAVPEAPAVPPPPSGDEPPTSGEEPPSGDLPPVP
jgi:hypothetical protein